MKYILTAALICFYSTLYSQNYENKFKYHQLNFSGDQILDSIYRFDKNEKITNLFITQEIKSTEVLSSKRNINLSNEVFIKLSYSSNKIVKDVFKNLVYNSFENETQQFSFHETIGFHNVYINYKDKTLYLLFTSLAFLDDYNTKTKKYHQEIVSFFKKNNAFILHKSSTIGSIYNLKKQMIFTINPYNSKDAINTLLSNCFKKFNKKIVFNNKIDIENLIYQIDE